MENEEMDINQKNEKSIWGNGIFKAFLFLLALLSGVAVVISGYIVLTLNESGYFNENYETYLRDVVVGRIWHDYYQWNYSNIDLDQMNFLEMLYGDAVKLELVETETGEVLWSNYEGGAAYKYHISTNYFVNTDQETWKNYLFKDPADFIYEVVMNGDGEVIDSTSLENYHFTRKDYVWNFYVDPDFSDGGVYHNLYDKAAFYASISQEALIALGISALIFFVAFLLLGFCIGHKNGKEGLVRGHLSGIPEDLFFVAWGIAAYTGIFFLLDYSYTYQSDYRLELFLVAVGGTFEILCALIYFSDGINRLKRRDFLKSMLCFRLWKMLWGGVKYLVKMTGEGIRVLCRNVRHRTGVVLGFLVLTFCEFFSLLICIDNRNFSGLMLLWLFEKVFLMVGVVYFANMFTKVQDASQAAVSGDYGHRLDTAGMILGYKKLGDNINNIAAGLNVALNERLKSERLKTELITNVSHDIKTPLTSIINYSELIANDPGDEEKVNEYAGVLSRQSRRLKKLLEDLLEASKASTGNIEVNLRECEVGVMLTQTIGEYEDKFREKGLTLIAKQPESPVRIMADGRHLWRIFDNLMGNIYKYSMENSRVYLTLEQKETNAEIVFRNMSKYELEVSTDELTERFVRGDKSRNQEGNGLGLSIAASLTSIQNGTMDIVTDGDLFKVILRFPVAGA